MRREIIRRLREQEQLRQQLEELDQALAQLAPGERLLLQKLVVDWDKGNASLLCEMLEVELSTLYRRKAQVLKKLEKILYP